MFDEPALPPIEPLRMSANAESVMYFLNWAFSGILQTGSPDLLAAFLTRLPIPSSLAHMPVI